MFVKDPGTATGDALSTVFRLVWFNETTSTWPPRPTWVPPRYVGFRSRLAAAASAPVDALPGEKWIEEDF